MRQGGINPPNQNPVDVPAISIYTSNTLQFSNNTDENNNKSPQYKLATTSNNQMSNTLTNTEPPLLC